jgi:hypothetical protein
MFERLADEDFAYLTTIGRHTGKAHTIENWFGRDDDRLYVLSGGGDRARELLDGKYQGWREGKGLSSSARNSLAVAIDLP